MEICFLVEGVDPRTSNSFQARHSYTEEEIVFNKQHAPCMGVGHNGKVEINLSLFHRFVDVEDNVEDPIPFASHS